MIDARSESEIQAEIVGSLKKLGYCCYSTSSYRTRRPGSGAGPAKGTPDLLVSHRAWRDGCWLGLEVKNAKGKLKPQQEVLLSLGRIVIVRSLDEALAVVKDFEIYSA